MLLKRINMPLRTIPNIVTACLCLHNLCIIHGDEFDLNWAKCAEEDMKRTSLETFGDLINIDTFHVLEADIAEMKKLQNGKVQVEFNDHVENDTSNLDIVQFKKKVVETRVDRKEKIKNMLKDATQVHLMLARNYYMEQLGKKTKKKNFQRILALI